MGCVWQVMRNKTEVMRNMTEVMRNMTEEQKGGKEPEYSLSQPRVVMQWEWPWIYKEPNRGDFWVLIKSQR